MSATPSQWGGYELVPAAGPAYQLAEGLWSTDHAEWLELAIGPFFAPVRSVRGGLEYVVVGSPFEADAVSSQRIICNQIRLLRMAVKGALAAVEGTFELSKDNASLNSRQSLIALISVRLLWELRIPESDMLKHYHLRGGRLQITGWGQQTTGRPLTEIAGDDAFWQRLEQTLIGAHVSLPAPTAPSSYVEPSLEPSSERTQRLLLGGLQSASSVAGAERLAPRKAARSWKSDSQDDVPPKLATSTLTAHNRVPTGWKAWTVMSFLGLSLIIAGGILGWWANTKFLNNRLWRNQDHVSMGVIVANDGLLPGAFVDVEPPEGSESNRWIVGVLEPGSEQDRDRRVEMIFAGQFSDDGPRAANDGSSPDSDQKWKDRMLRELEHLPNRGGKR